jgi:hypothetical protein
MNRSKFVLGIAIALLGGAVMLESMLSGVSHFTGRYYGDFQTYSIELQASQLPLKTSFISVQKDQLLSVWFRYSNRRIDHKELKIAVFLIDEDENLIRKFEKDLRFGRFRNSKKKVRYIKLGEYRPGKEFRGYLHYKLAGTWTPTKTSALVMRKSPPVMLPLKQLGFFLAGLITLIAGSETIVKTYKKRRRIVDKSK